MKGRPPAASGILPSPEGAWDYLAIDKPAGRAVTGPDGLLFELRRLHGDDLELAHRLDRETSGVLLLARGHDALVRAHQEWGESVTKTYVARTRGLPLPREGVIDQTLLEHRTSREDLIRRALRAAYGPARAGHLLSGRRVNQIPPIPPAGRTAAHPAGRPAQTTYRVLSEERDGNALVELVPRQGRMHQLRVHLLSIGTPLLFDRLYDPEAKESDPPPLLHALRLVWRRPEGEWVWESPLPGR